MTKTHWMLGSATLLFVGLCVGAFFLTHERKEQEVRVPPSGEARKNAYLALERVYGELGLETETRQTASVPPENKGFVLLADRSRNFTPEQVESWRSWIESGGHLALPAPIGEAAHAPVLESFGIEQKEVEQKEVEQKEASEESEESANGESEEKDEETDEKEGEEKAKERDGATAGSADRKYEFDSAVSGLDGWSVPEADWRARSTEDSLVAVSRPVENGRLTLLSDVQPFSNSHLDRADHATFAWELTALDSVVEGQQRGAAIVLFSAQKSWFAYVVRNTWPFFVGLGLIVVFVLNAARWRFGPLFPEPPSERRSRVEHIRATGTFLWEHEGAADLLEAARTSLIEALARRRPALADASGERRRTIVADMLDLDSEETRLIFDDRDKLSKAEFISRIDLIEEYRRNL